VRCVVRWLVRAGALDASGAVKLESPSGPIAVELLADGRVRVDMGEPRFAPAAIPLVAEKAQDRYVIDVAGNEVELVRVLNVLLAVRDVAARARPDVALANHLVMGPLVLARGLGDAVPYAAKIHGSALEYTVKRDPARFLPAAREGLERARTVLVGSRHTAESLWAAMDDDGLPARTRLGPPGVDIEEFRPRPRGEAAAAVTALATRLAGTDSVAEDHAFARDEAAAGRALQRLDLASGRDRHVAFVGKLIVSKGIDLLAAAWPLVLRDVPCARLVVVGFGAFRAALEDLLAALAVGDLDRVRAIAAEGRALEGGPRAPLRHLLAFLDSLSGEEAEAYRAAAAALGDRVVLTGRLEHDELAPLLAACEAQVVPSTFPEAFGMVAAEAAACGALPVSARAASSAAMNASVDGKRSSGRLASARATIASRRGETSGRTSRTLGTGSWMCFRATAMKFCPVYGGSPARSS